jgi:Tol biopolymer transport system component
MLGIANGSLQVAIRSSRPQVLLNQEVTNFGFSPDGHRVVYSVESPHAEAGIWMADLMSGRTKLLQRDSDATWTVYSWSAADRPIMLGSNDGGPPLQFAASDQVDVCGHEILSIADHRIATFGVTGSPDYLATPAGWRFTALSCAPNGEFIAAIGTRSAAAVGGTLLILDGNGNIVQELGTPGYVDLHPLWGPPGSGVVFLQTASGTGPTTVTYISEGGRSMPQKLSVSGDFDANMDWSADGPLGHPTN